MLTIFYDSQCPLCVAEMKSLKKKDIQNQIVLEVSCADSDMGADLCKSDVVKNLRKS